MKLRSLFIATTFTSVSFAACFPSYLHDTTPEVISALPRDFRTTDKKIAVIMVRRLQSGSSPQASDRRSIGEPLITTTKEFRETSRHIGMNSFQLRSPLGVIVGTKQGVEELCLIGADGAVGSLRRIPAEKGLSDEWREKATGKLSEPGKQFLIALLSDTSKEVFFPPEVLSACSLGERKSEIHWSELGREELRQFLSEVQIPAPGK